ncbi:MAG TPA: hypothetical protein VFO79_03205, partial [Xanthomonadales bacterium]|nr:hypothetical protein [Xanthomonadales bacterium]
PELVAGDTDDNDVILYDPLAGSLALLAPTANEDTESPDISDNGRYVCYESTATNLVANDTNGRGDVFRLDRTTGELLLVSRTPGGASGNGSSFGCDVADNGTVAFVSAATDLVAGAGRTDGAAYVYVPGQSSLVLASVAADQSPANGPSRDVSISTDGARIAFASSASNLPGPTAGAYEIYVRDRVAQQTHRISRATDPQVAPTQASFQPHMAAAGTSVVFDSTAANLVAGDTNGSLDVFRYDYATQAMQRVSLAPAPLASGGGGGVQRVSGDGSLVVFLSNAPALLAGTGSTASQVFLYRRATRALTILTRNAQGQATREFGEEPVISADGRYVAYASRAADLAPGADTNGERDIHLHDVVAGTTVRISRTPAGNAPASGLARYPTISADGSRVVFFSTQAELGAVGLGSLFLWSRGDNSIRRIDLAADGSIGSSLLDGLEISGNGSKLAFRSLSNNLLPGVGNGFYQMYRKDLDSGVLELVSHAPDGSQANGGSVAPSISHDGNVVAFTSFASNLVAGDDANEDLFVTNFAAGGAVTRVTPGGTGGAIIASLSADARFLAFRSARTNLVPNDTNGVTDIFVYDRTLQTFARASVDAQRQQLAGATNAPRLSADGGWITMTIDPGSGIVVPGRAPAIRNDVLLGINPQVNLFSSGFE